MCQAPFSVVPVDWCQWTGDSGLVAVDWWQWTGDSELVTVDTVDPPGQTRTTQDIAGQTRPAGQTWIPGDQCIRPVGHKDTRTKVNEDFVRLVSWIPHHGTSSPGQCDYF